MPGPYKRCAITTLLMKTYSEVISLKTFEERYEYLRLGSAIGEDTFGMMRYLNQALYSSQPWRSLRNKLMVRDNGMDMACDGHPVSRCVLHHINPISVEDFENDSPLIWDPENLICVDFRTHNAIHYGTFDLIKPLENIERKPNDTIPWR